MSKSDYKSSERVREIAEYLYELSQSLIEEAEETDDEDVHKQLKELGDTLCVISKLSYTKDGVLLSNIINDMMFSREMMIKLRDKEKNGELPESLSSLLDNLDGGADKK